MTLSPLLSSIEARVKAATPGPYDETGMYNILRAALKYSDHNVFTDAVPDDAILPSYHNETYKMLAHAPTDLTRLIAICRAQERVIEAQKEEVNRSYQMGDGYYESHEFMDAISTLATLLEESKE